MSHRTSAVVERDSITPCGDATRLTSIYVVFPKMVLGERNRHRGFSLSDRSSRAVPPEKLIQEVRDDPAMPALFRGRTAGMGGGEELTGYALNIAEEKWRRAALLAANAAGGLMVEKLAKEIVNRPLDPYIRMHSLMTATRDVWLNFFGLRLDAGADPTIQVLAQRCYEAYRASTPKLLQPGEWHLPFIDENDWNTLNDFCFDEDHQLQRVFDEASAQAHMLDYAKRLSAARCAHLSYDLETDQRMTIEKALKIYDRLVTSRPVHASPTEHQATPDFHINKAFGNRIKKPIGDIIWEHPEQHGNLYGWVQARKLIPGEAVAELPEAYVL